MSFIAQMTHLLWKNWTDTWNAAAQSAYKMISKKPMTK